MDKVLTIYPVDGYQKVEMDGKAFVSAYWDGAAPASISAGLPIVVALDADKGRKIAAPVTLAVYQQIGGIHVSRADAGYVWVQVEGTDSDVQVDGTADVAKSDFLKLINTGTALITDGATRTTDSVAMATVAYTTNSAAAKAVIWLGQRATVPAA